MSHYWCKITSVLGWPANLPLKLKTFKVGVFLALLSSTFFLFTPSPLLHLTSPSLIQQSYEKPAIVLPKSWLQIVSSVVKTQRCRWREITLHSASVCWCHGPLVPPIFSWIAWRRFYWAMLLEVQDITQPVTQPVTQPLPPLHPLLHSLSQRWPSTWHHCHLPKPSWWHLQTRNSGLLHMPSSPCTRGRDSTVGKTGFRQHSPKVWQLLEQHLNNIQTYSWTGCQQCQLTLS